MGLLKKYKIILDVIRKTATGTIHKKDFEKVYNAFIDISLFTHKFGKDNSFIENVYKEYNSYKNDAEELRKKDKSESVEKEIYCIDKSKLVLDNAVKGDLDVRGLSEVLGEIARENQHHDKISDIDFWSYEIEEP